MGLLAPKQHGFRQSNTNKLTIDTDNIIHYRDLQEFADAVALMLTAVMNLEQKVAKEKISLELHR